MYRIHVMVALVLCASVCLQAEAQEPPVQIFSERDGLIVLEAEHAQKMNGYTVEADAQAVGGHIAVSGSTMTFRILVLNRGRYTMHLRCRSKDDKGNSCFLKIDGRPIRAPDGIEHHTGVIQTQIGPWGWFTKWRETDNIPITLDLEPGIREFTFSPREPQKVDRIVLRRGKVKGGAFSKIKGGGPDATPHVIDFPWPGMENREFAQLVYQAQGGQLGVVIKKLRAKAKRKGLSDDEQTLLDTCSAWIDKRLDEMEQAAQAGDYLTAVDRATVVALLAKGDARLPDIGKRVKEWKSTENYQAGAILYRILIEKNDASESEHEGFMNSYKQRFPNSPFLQAPWYFHPK